MSYHKYTNGTAFTLTGQDYSGFFNISQGVPYTEKFITSDSMELSYKTTFIAEFFKKLMEYDVTYQNLAKITPYYSNPFDILNVQGMNTLINSVNSNNLEIFKGLSISNPTIYNFEKNQNLYYGIVSPSDSMVGTQSYKHIEPFTTSSAWAFMDAVITGAFFIDTNENFKYFCSTGPGTYVITGSFKLPTTLTISSHLDLHPDYTTNPDFVYHYHNDHDNLKLYSVNNDVINVYDTSNYQTCDNLVLLDQIALSATTTTDYIYGRIGLKTFTSVHQTFSTRFSTDNPNNPNFIKIGHNVRTGLIDNVLTISNKHSSTIYQTINLSSYIENALAIDISPSTDDIAIIHEKNGSMWILTLYNLDITTIINTELQNLTPNLSWYKVKFSNIDSNQIHIYSPNQYQTRYLSKPQWPAGQLDINYKSSNSRLSYFHPYYTFSNAKQQFNSINMKFNSDSYNSNNLNVLAASQITNNDNMYMVLHTIGRLYALKQPISDIIYIPLDIQKYFTNIAPSESSLGIYINSVLSNLIKDTMILLSNAQGRFSVSISDTTLNELHDITFDMENLYINGNETPNIITLQRILTIISNIQSQLLPI